MPFAIGAALADAVRILNDARDGNIVIAGLSVGTASTPFSQELKDALARLGSTKASEPNFVAGWLFAVRKGSPSSAVEGYAPYGPGDPGLTLDAFFPSPDGPSYRAVLTLDGAPGEEFQVGAGATPSMRYHGADALVGSANRADMLLITHPAFAAEANRLAAHRAAHDSLVVRVVDVNTIYDEFNNGVKSPVAIRESSVAESTCLIWTLMPTASSIGWMAWAASRSMPRAESTISSMVLPPSCAWASSAFAASGSAAPQSHVGQPSVPGTFGGSSPRATCALPS